MLWEFEKFNFSTEVYYVDAEGVRACFTFYGGSQHVEGV